MADKDKKEVALAGNAAAGAAGAVAGGMAVVDKGTLAVTKAPDYMADAGREGLETLTRDDVSIARLALAQPLSPEVTEGDPKLIEGLKPGDLFNSVTKEIYGTEVHVQILRKDAPRAMEWRDINSGGGIIDKDVPLDDERLKWGPNGEKPVAMLYRDYIARLLPIGELIALSFKSSGIKVAKMLNGLIVLRNKPIYAGRYAITTGVELKPKPHKVYKVANASKPKFEGDQFPGWVTEEDLKVGRDMYEAVKDLDAATIDREDATSFDPEALEQESQARHDM